MMFKFFAKYWLIILILVLAIFLRFYKLSTYPAFNADEASNGYDAYSLIQTGKDQHGNPWPITFQSFNDYKPGLYVYIIMPFVKVMGLNELAVRIPSAAAGVLTVLLVYFLVVKLFKSKRMAEIAALFLAISPWHIQFSRGGWEVNVATFFIITGVYFFIKFVKSGKWQPLFLSVFVLVLSLYTYHTARVVVPLLGLTATLLYKKELFIRENTKKLIVGVIFGIIILIPLAKDLASPGALSRVAGVGLFADPGPINRIDEQRGEYSNPNNLLGKILHNKAVNYGLAFAENWASHFQGEFLFFTGDGIQRDQVPETGEMYLVDIIFLAAGIIGIAKVFGNDSGEEKRSWKLIITWLLFAPIASALTFQAPNAVRAQNMVVPLVLISAYGFMEISKFLTQKNLKFGIWILVIITAWCFARYEHMYWVHMAKEYPFSSQYGVKELVAYVEANESKYQSIVVTTRYDQPYILFLFYMKYPPQNFQGHHVLTTKDQFGFSTVAFFDKFNFEAIDFQSDKNDFPNSLIIGTPTEIPKAANIVKRIYGTNGYEYFDVVVN